jgi:putative flippase GtrA
MLKFNIFHFRKNVINQFVSYVGVGGVGTVAHYVTLVLLVQMMNLKPVVGSVCGFAVGAMVNYHLNYHITFHSRSKHIGGMTKFLLVALSGLALNTCIFIFATSVLSLHYMLAQFMATGFVVIWTFFCNRSWTFKEIRRGTDDR